MDLEEKDDLQLINVFREVVEELYQRELFLKVLVLLKNKAFEDFKEFMALNKIVDSSIKYYEQQGLEPEQARERAFELVEDEFSDFERETQN